MIKLTKEQQRALKGKWESSQLKAYEGPRMAQKPVYYESYLEFRRSVHPQFGFDDGGIMVQWCGMWLGIETDGYTHS